MRRITLITGRMDYNVLRLQPWRYLHEVSLQLYQRGHEVTVITDGEADPRLDQNGPGPYFCRIPSVDRYHWAENSELQQAVKNSRPEVILWHVGMTSFLHQQLADWPGIPKIGIFPGIVYQLSDFRQVGMRNMINERSLTWIHLLGACIPRKLLRQPIDKGWLHKLVTLSHTTRDKLIHMGISTEAVEVISPGIDEIWFHPPGMNGSAAPTREDLGYSAQDKIILYFGSPQPLRGLHDLIRAVEIASSNDKDLKILILSRQREDEFLKENAGLRDLLERSQIRSSIKVVSGFLDPEKLVEYIAISDTVALPFQLVPADAPLSLLEAQAQGKPVITTRVASLPEMVAGSTHFLADPANPASLSQAVLAASKSIDTTRLKNGNNIQGRSPNLRRWQEVGTEWSHLVQSL